MLLKFKVSFQSSNGSLKRLDIKFDSFVSEQYWPDLSEYKKYIKMSQNQFINVINS